MTNLPTGLPFDDIRNLMADRVQMSHDELLERLEQLSSLVAPLDDEQRRELGLDDNAMGLRVEHLGQYGAHALAKNSGFQQGDVLVAVDGDTTVQRESDLFARLIRQHQAGDEVPFTVLRDGNRLDLPLKMQE